MKKKISVGCFVLIAFLILVFFSIGNTFEPLDPFPRANERVQCPDGSSVVFYRKKAGWFTEQTELSVRLVDKRGKVIHTQSLGTFSHWVDSEMKVLETPQIFCD